MSYAYFKNKFLPESECVVPISDRSFRFGDGIFETALVVNGKIYNFPHHLERLQNGLSAYKLNIDVSNIESLCGELIAKNKLQNGYIRITVSRGENSGGVLGYLPVGTKPYFIIQSAARAYPQFKEIRLFVSSYPAAMRTPSKTNNALLYTMAMLEAEENNCENALLLDVNGNICETASGNIFWIKNGKLFTPSTELALVPGTLRRKILEIWEGEKEEGFYKLEDLKTADEIFMSNISVIIAPITNIIPLGNELKSGSNTIALRKVVDSEILSW